MKEKTLKASLTVEAAWIMAMVLLSVSVMLQQAARIHDETKAAMGLHEAVEKGRHGSACGNWKPLCPGHRNIWAVSCFLLTAI